jgi:hypothetical protein
VGLSWSMDEMRGLTVRELDTLVLGCHDTLDKLTLISKGVVMTGGYPNETYFNFSNLAYRLTGLLVYSGKR